MDTTNQKRNSKSKVETENAAPVHTIREGAVAASIWKRQSPSGFPYFDFSLSRSWKSMSSGKTGYSKNFFDKNRESLVNVVDGVTKWIADNTPADMIDAARKADAGDGDSAELFE